MIIRCLFFSFVCITDRSKWKHTDGPIGPDRTGLDKIPKHNFKKKKKKKKLAFWPRPLSTNQVDDFNCQPVISSIKTISGCNCEINPCPSHSHARKFNSTIPVQILDGISVNPCGIKTVMTRSMLIVYTPSWLDNHPPPC